MSDRRARHGEARSQRATRPDGSRRTKWLIAIAAIAIGVIAFGVIAFGPRQQAAVTPTTAGGAQRTATTSDAGGSFPIIAYQGTDVLGAERLDFTQLLGTGTPVVLNFWAGQCPPCRAEMPAFQRVYETYGDGFLLVGVDIGPYVGLGSRQSAIDLLAELDISYPAAGAEDARAVQDYSVLGMPTTIFYSGDGVEADRHTGLLTEAMLVARVQDLIGA